MKVLNKILFFPIYIIALLINLLAEVVKQAFSFVSGLFFLLMLIVIRQIKCGLLPQIKNNFLRYAEALQSVLFATISAHCFM